MSVLSEINIDQAIMKEAGDYFNSWVEDNQQQFSDEIDNEIAKIIQDMLETCESTSEMELKFLDVCVRYLSLSLIVGEKEDEVKKLCELAKYRAGQEEVDAAVEAVAPFLEEIVSNGAKDGSIYISLIKWCVKYNNCVDKVYSIMCTEEYLREVVGLTEEQSSNFSKYLRDKYDTSFMSRKDGSDEE